MDYFNDFVQLPDVRRAIHVGDKTWNDGKAVEMHLVEDVMKSDVKPWIQTIMDSGYKVGHNL